MLGFESIVTYPTALAALAAAGVGFAAFWANPKRVTNRAVLTGSVHVAVWLATLQLAIHVPDGLVWLKSSCSVGALLPLHILIIQQAISGRLTSSTAAWVRANAAWLVVSAGLTIVPFTDVFIPPDSTAEHRLRGWGYYAYIGFDILLYALLLRDGVKTVRSSTGARRLELQLWLLGGCVIALTVLCLMALTELTHDQIFIRAQPWLVLSFYAATAFVITTHRIFDARQVVLFALEKTILVTTVAGFAYVMDFALISVVPEPFAFFATTAVSLWVAVTLNAWLDRMFQFYPQATVARQAAFAAAQRQLRFEDLERAFRSVLRGWGQTEHILIATSTGDMLASGGVEIPGSGTVLNAMKYLRWATPERLTRERASPRRAAVGQFLEEKGLGVVVLQEGPAFSLMIGIGVGRSRRPYTYPQVTQLLELASIMESALERAHFSARFHHAEQLATAGLLGASLAHEIRNPLVSIKTFVQLLPTHHHDPLFREKFFRLIGEEVGRIDQLTQQLLDLAAPRVYAAEYVELHPVLHASLELVAPKAAHKNIRLVTDFRASPDSAYTDPSAAKQVMLNLCFNAIQAVEERAVSEPWVRVSTRNTPVGVEMAVSDNGPGIPDEVRPRLFKPFQTTKSKGFGLGLAICSDILGNLNASITVDPPVPGEGATFRVTFPCQPSSS